MATNEKKLTIDELMAKNKIEYGSKGHIALLEAGYGMTVAKAKQIVKERPENPQLWPFDLFEKAQSMLEALNTKPTAIDPEPGWHRQRG